jgi:hypothetical protein
LCLQERLEFPDILNSKVKNGCSQGGVGSALCEYFDEMVARACASRSDDRYLHA